MTSASPSDQYDSDGIPVKGLIVSGRYRVSHPVGRGGMGAVVAAEDLETRRLVAIKVLYARAARKEGAVERFLREAKAATSLRSEHVVKVFDVGHLSNDSPFMVMEYLDGLDLRDVIIEHQRRLPIETAVDYALQACIALAACHSHGIVHRDFKPDNLMVIRATGGRPIVKLLDFGISKLEQLEERESYHSLTGTLDVFGTPTHMSPEQVRSAKNVDARTDIWALGVVLYELFTGSVPFMAPALPALSVAICNDPAPPPRRRRPDLPAALESLVLACLEKRAEHRPQDALTVAAGLEPFASEAGREYFREASRLITRPLPPLLADDTATVPLSNRALTQTVDAPRGAAATLRKRPASRWDDTVSPRQRAIIGVATGVLAGTLVFFFAVLFWVAVGKRRVLRGSVAPPPSAVTAASNSPASRL